jgi:hypothetical protein
MSFGETGLLNIYVPFVEKTEARKHGRPMSVLARHLLDGYP